MSVDTREFTLTKMPAEGERKEMTLPIIDNTRPTAYWLPRSVFQQLLYSEVHSIFQDCVRIGYMYRTIPEVISRVIPVPELL